MTTQHEPAGPLDSSSSTGGLLRLRLDVSYDGTGFHGWARQPDLRTVQGELEQALRRVLRVAPGQPVRVAVAGRTDAGVHAVGQVCHSDLPEEAWSAQTHHDPGAAVAGRLNGVLPPDVRVRRVSVAPPGFDARWSAAWRRYCYQVADAPSSQDPRTRGHVLWSSPLDVAAMDVAAGTFLGEHDFAAFCRAREGASTVRTVHDIGWARQDDRGDPNAGAGLVSFTIRSDAFCHSMVRSLVGAFLAVGAGRWPVERPAELLARARRVPTVATAPAHGLTLVAVGYPPDRELAEQAQRARRWRGR